MMKGRSLNPIGGIRRTVLRSRSPCSPGEYLLKSYGITARIVPGGRTVSSSIPIQEVSYEAYVKEYR